MAGIISATEKKPIYTTLIVKKYDEALLIKATKFLQSFYKVNISKLRYPAIDVRRGSEKVGVDVMLGHQGIRTQVTQATQKVYDLFYFRYFSDATELQCYFNLFGSAEYSVNDMTEFVNGVALLNKVNQELIDRATELFCASIFEFGICTSLRTGDVINFNRKAGSMVDLGAGNYWSVSGVDPATSIAAGCTFIRQFGKYSGGIFNAILGTQNYLDLISNDVILARSRAIETLKLEEIIKPELKLEGQTYSGTMTAGPYTVHLWQYDQYYDAPNAYPITPATTYTSTPYWNPKKTVILPVNPDFELLYAACPQVSNSGDTANLQAGKYILKEEIDTWENTHKFGIESRVLPVPVAIDQLYTLKASA